MIYKLTVVQIARNAASLIETNTSLPSTQQKADGPFLEPHESSPLSSVLFRIHFTVTSKSPPRHAYVFERAPFLQVSHQNPAYISNKSSITKHVYMIRWITDSLDEFKQASL
jgi:hypothetical protein